MDPFYFPYPSRRQLVYGRRGMVCTSQPLAAVAGLDILKAGGNAVDAAVATAIAMTVLAPVSNGFGSATFARVWAGGASFTASTAAATPPPPSAATAFGSRAMRKCPSGAGRR